MNNKNDQILKIFGCTLLLSLFFSASIGAINISGLSILQNSLSEQEKAVLFSIRLPRVLLGALVGSALAVSGAAIQGLFRNPLADPGLIGISSGAALAVAIVIVFAGSISNTIGLYSLSIAAFIGGLVTCMIIFKFANITGSISVTYMLLAGIALNAITGAGTGFLTYISNDQQLRSLTFWTMGSLGGALWSNVIVAATIIIPSTLLIIRYSKDLNILMLGENEAKYLGVNTEKLKQRIVILSALSIGTAVAVSGIIGFVGLVVPHLIRLAITPNNKFLIPACAIAGAILLLLADTIARTIASPLEIPVGLITSLIGGPFFLWLLTKQYKQRFGI